NKLLAKNPDARFQTASEIAELLSRHLAHLQYDPFTAFQAEGQPQPPTMRQERPGGNGEDNGRPKHRAARSRLRWPLLVGAAVLLVGIVVLAVLQGVQRPAAPGRSTKYAPGAADRPVKVFILAGDSNMAGRAKVSVLKYQANQADTKERYQHLL